MIQDGYDIVDAFKRQNIFRFNFVKNITSKGKKDYF